MRRGYPTTLDRKPGRPHSGTGRGSFSVRVGPVVGRSGNTRNVRWRVEHPQENHFVLRNIGDDAAVNDLSRIDAITRNLARATVVEPGEVLDALLMPAWGHPLPNQLYVRWVGQDGWVAVPLTRSK